MPSLERVLCCECIIVDRGNLYRFDDAEEACRNAIEIWEEAFGPASPVTTTSLELLANIMRDTGRPGALPALWTNLL